MGARAHKDIDSTIRQLRRKRRSIVQRRKRIRLMLGTTGAFAFALGTATTVASFTGTDLADAAAARAQSFIDLMGKRSPGERSEAQLTKTKSHKPLAERDAPEVARAPANLVKAIVPPIPELIPIDAGPPPQLTFLEMPSLPNLLVPPSGGPKVPPGGGGGCCGGPPSAPPLTPPNTPPPPLLPEPGTWLTMLLGFGFIGWLIRRNKRADRSQPALPLSN